MALDVILGTNQGSGTSTTIVLTTGATVAVGSRAFVAVVGESTATHTVADNSGNGYTWTSLTTTTKGGDHRLQIFTALCTAGLASGTAITVTFGSTTINRAVGGFSWAGTDTSSGSTGMDVSSTKTENGVAAWASADLVTTFAADLLIGVGTGYGNGSPTSTAATNYTEAVDVTVSGAQESLSMVYREVAGTGTYNPGGTWSVAPGEGIILGVAFKLAEEAAAAPTLRTVRSNLRLT
jgi:hypothetical protein